MGYLQIFSMVWTPIITDNTHKELINLRLESIISELHNCKCTSLLGGNAGIALFYYYYFLFTANKDYRLIANSLLLNSINSISKDNYNFSFGKGACGIAWCLQLLQKNGLIQFNPELVLSNIDKHIYNYTSRCLIENNYDFIYGGIGGAIYFLERIPNTYAYSALIKIIDLIDEIAEITPNNITWLDSFALSTIDSKKKYNLGLAHGIPSVIYVLSRAFQAGIKKKKVHKLINGSINWLLKKRLMKSQISIFPNYIADGVLPKDSRLAWCYGDLGIANSIWHAGVATNSSLWKSEAISILLNSTKRVDLEKNYVMDACLCHGASGIAHIYNRFYHETSIDEFKKASIYWYNITVNLANVKSKYSGYKTFEIYKEKERWRRSLGLLEGIAGIGLSLISSISKSEPKWDRCLLLS